MISDCTRCGKEMIIVDKTFEGVPFYIVKCTSCDNERTVQAFLFENEKKMRCS